MTPRDHSHLQAVCVGCGSERVAVPDSDGKVNKLCPRCGGAAIAWVPVKGKG